MGNRKLCMGASIAHSHLLIDGSFKRLRVIMKHQNLGSSRICDSSCIYRDVSDETTKDVAEAPVYIPF